MHRVTRCDCGHRTVDFRRPAGCAGVTAVTAPNPDSSHYLCTIDQFASKEARMGEVWYQESPAGLHQANAQKYFTNGGGPALRAHAARDRPATFGMDVSRFCTGRSGSRLVLSTPRQWLERPRRHGSCTDQSLWISRRRLAGTARVRPVQDRGDWRFVCGFVQFAGRAFVHEHDREAPWELLFYGL